MISNQILQSTIDGVKAITKIDISVMDTEGSVLASTEETRNSKGLSFVPDMLSSKADSMQLRCFPDPEPAGGLQGTFR